jgi:4-hydroxybenzoate polyprenyltransferase
MKDYFQLIRYKNLIFIIAVQWIMHHCIVLPILTTFGIGDYALNTNLLWLIIFATVFIAAGGYAINDYFDTKIDLLNRPNRQIVGRTITKRTASWIHHITTAIGVLLGLFVSWKLKSLSLCFIFLMTPGLLWFYSASYKRMPFLGNFIISLCTALAPILIALANGEVLQTNYSPELLMQTPILPTIYTWILGFSGFAFILSMIRETIKDMEDEYGDKENECRTLPVVFGISKTKWILYSYIVLFIALLIWSYVSFIQDFALFKTIDEFYSLRFIICGLIVPILLLTYFIWKAKTPTEFHSCSICTKIIMIIGLAYSFLFYFLIAKANGLALFGIFFVNPQ